MAEQNQFPKEELMAKIKELVKQGNIARILITRKESTILNIPLNVGVVGAAVGVAAAPWALIAAAVASMGLDCKVILVKTDGNTIELLNQDMGKKAVSTGASLLGRLTKKDD